MTQPMLPPMLCDPEVLAYRSDAPVDGYVAARLAEAVSRPIGERDWMPRPPRKMESSRADLPRFLFGEVWVDRRASSVYGDVLWLLAQLGRVACDERFEFEIQIGALQGRVSTGGLDSGALRILQLAQGRAAPRPRALRERRQKSATPARAG